MKCDLLLSNESGQRNNLPSLLQLSKIIYPDARGMKKLRTQWRFCFWAIKNYSTLRSMQLFFSEPRFAPLLQCQPRLLEKPFKPYITPGWGVSQRKQTMFEHYQLLDVMLGGKFMQLFNEQGLELLNFTTQCGERFRVTLCYDGGLAREGELVIVLSDSLGRRFYSLACTLCQPQYRTLYIGALQGPGPEVTDRQDLIRQLTKSTFGLRPKALMIELVQMIGRALGVQQLLAISNKGHVYQALRYTGSKKSKVSFDYDQLWKESAGTAVNKSFYELPIEILRTELEQIKAKKRSQYRNRYAWLDEVEGKIAESLLDIHREAAIPSAGMHCPRRRKQPIPSCSTGF